MQFKVPQNIDMQDKIVGPLTMTQFLYVLVGGMIDYVLLQTISTRYPAIFFAIALPIAGFSLAMAFLKINEIPFPRFVQAAIIFVLSPKQRVWQKSVDMSSAVRIEPLKKKFVPKMIRKQIEKSEIEKMAAVLDTAGWAAVRDQKLKEFVSTFDETHHSLEKDPGVTTNANPPAGGPNTRVTPVEQK